MQWKMKECGSSSVERAEEKCEFLENNKIEVNTSFSIQALSVLLTALFCWCGVCNGVRENW